jgi:hypothetical protein
MVRRKQGRQRRQLRNRQSGATGSIELLFELAPSWRRRYLDITQKGTMIESLISDPKSNKTVVYALQAVLIELSNESGRGVDMPGVAGAFYRAVAFELRGWPDIHIQRCFRHLDALLRKPNLVTANALIKYWDDNKSADQKRDPFP